MQFEEIKKEDQTYICGNYARFPVAIIEGKGSTCYDADGKRYIDFTSGIGVNSLGFCYKPWSKAVSDQAAKLGHTSNLFYTQPQISVAKMLHEKTDCSKTLFCNSGAEANEAAIKAARKYGIEKKGGCHIVGFNSAFHGRTMGALAATPQQAYQDPFGPMLDGFSFADSGDIQSFLSAVKSETCGVILELIQGEGGVRNMNKAFVKEVSEYCQEKDILLIVDEVQTGIGRTGSFLACEQFEIKPDMVTLAKGLGGGLPVGAVLFFGETGEILKPGHHGTTYGGNPIVMAGAKVVLETLTVEFLSEVKRKSELFRERIKDFAGVNSVSGLGMMIGIELKNPENLKSIVTKCIEKGLLVLTAKDRIRLLPPLAISDNEINNGLEILEQTLQEV